MSIKTISLDDLGVSSVGDSCFIKLPDGRLVEVYHSTGSIDFSHKDSKEDDSNETLVCYQGAR